LDSPYITVRYARGCNARKERVAFETRVLKLPSWHRNARRCDAGVTQNLPLLTKLTLLTLRSD